MEQEVRVFAVAYDASCGPCSAFRRAVGALDTGRRLRFVSLEEAEASGMLDSLDAGARYSSFHLVRLAPGAARPEQVWSGADALLPLARLLSPLGAAAWVMGRLPAGARAAAFAYSRLSALHRGCPA
ncbi:MAG: DUF393 domain-containing protein [Nitrososphaerota archaeon]|nr:DUF393 domain-containing protein [Nitrososphaerota archaeon]MDG6967288.1 DUF393 domain-containing protein [Nitrososphaerota archaeon]MDG6977919.1 DUF393 domain-containing protein [Nitrososphaerota archaeon]